MTLPQVCAVALSLALATLAAGCGSEKPASTADTAITKCRKQWSALARQVEGKETETRKSGLAPRWNSVIATIDYHVTSASEKDCGLPIDQQQSAINALEDFGVKLRPYDMQFQAAEVATPVRDYLANPLPKLAAPAKGKPAGKVPPKANVQKAFTVLTASAELASAELAPGWQQALTVDLGEAGQQLAIKDLAFLASQSPRYLICANALKVIQRAMTAQENAIS